MPRLAVLSLALAASALAGCDTAATRTTVEGYTWDEVSANVTRASEEAFAELPFTRGSISVVFTEDGELNSDRLYPCQSGNGVCLNSQQGRSAVAQRTNSHFILSFGDGRTFFLRPGGSGTLRTPQGDVPLAWNADINGVPIWPQPTWPYTPWITQVEPGPNP